MNPISIKLSNQQVLEISHIPSTGLQEPWVTRLGRPDVEVSNIGLELDPRSIRLCVCNLDRFFFRVGGHGTGHGLGEQELDFKSFQCFTPLVWSIHVSRIS